MSDDNEFECYEPFEYLESNQYEQFNTHVGLYFGEPYEVTLPEEQEHRVERIRQEFPVISLHDHPVRLPKNVEEYGSYTSSGWVRTAYDGLKNSPLDAVFVSNLGVRTWDEAINALGKRFCDIGHQDFVVKAESLEDIQQAKRNGKVAFISGFETSTMIENKLDRLDILFGLGVRTLGITYSESNSLGTGLGETFQGGLTKFGQEAVKRMNDIGFVIDVSHSSDQTSLDVCDVSDDPVIASHNGAQALHDITRLDPDNVLKAVADTGGLIGIQAAPHTTSTFSHPRHGIESFMEHFEYVKDIVGIEHVTFGPDVNYGDHVGLHKHFGKDMDQFPDEIITDIEYTKGLDNPTEAWHNIIRWLVKQGYSDKEIQRVIGGNTLRVLEQVWPGGH